MPAAVSATAPTGTGANPIAHKCHPVTAANRRACGSFQRCSTVRSQSAARVLQPSQDRRILRQETTRIEAGQQRRGGFEFGQGGGDLGIGVEQCATRALT